MPDIRVQDEKGVIHVFPDGSTSEMIARVLNVQPPTPRDWTDSVGDFASSLWKQINPIEGFKGAAQLTAHPIDTLKSDAATRQDIYNNAEVAFKKGDYATGARHLLHSFVPLFGPQLEAAANDFANGNYAKGTGASVGMGVAMAAPELIKNARVPTPNMEGTASRMYESALKPSTTIDASKRAALVRTGLENEIPVSAAGAEKLSNLVDDLNAKIKDTIDQGNQQGKTVNKFAVASRLSDTTKKFSNQVTPLSDLGNVADTGNEFLDTQPTEIPASQAQSLKQGTYQQLKNKAYGGELKSASVEAQKALARGIKEELVNQFPELKDLNAAESKLLQLDPILERAVNRISNHQIIGIGTPVAVGAAKAVSGSNSLSVVTGVLKAVVDNPAVKSRIAIALARKGVTTENAFSRLAAYSNALGNAVNGAPADHPQDEQ